MRLEQTIAFDVTGQKLFLDVPNAQPASVTSVTVFDEGANDDGDTEAATSGSASVSSVDTPLVDAAGRGQADPTLICVGSVAGIDPDRVYLLEGPDGQTESVAVERVDAASRFVYARHAIGGMFESSPRRSRLKGTRIEIALLGSWVADTDNLGRFRVRWVYSIDGVDAVRDSYFRLVRYPADFEVFPSHIEEALPGWLNGLSQDFRAGGGALLIARAYRDVAIDLKALKIPVETARDPEILNQLAVQKTIVLAMREKVYIGNADPFLLEDSRRDYDSLIGRFVRERGVMKRDTGTGGGGQETKARRLFTR